MLKLGVNIDHVATLREARYRGRGHGEPDPVEAARVCEAAARPACGAITFAQNPTVPVSSTEIRRRVEEGQPIDELVPPPVSRYIQHYGLYRKAQREKFD